MGKSSKQPDLGGNLDSVKKGYSQSYLQMLLDSNTVTIKQAQDAGYKGEEVASLLPADESTVNAALAQLVETTLAQQKIVIASGPLNHGSFSDPTNTTGAEQGAADMSEQTEQRRRNPADVRICDLQEGDKLGWVPKDGDKTTITELGVVVESPSDTNDWTLAWGNGVASTSPWEVSKSSTKLLANWVDYGTTVFLPENITNPIVVSKRGGVDFDSVILHKDKKKQILDTISQVDNYDLIFKQWGFSEIFEKGTAIAMLFYGEPGTGKTLMAQAIADKYGKKLTMVSTAEIETPEPGGAERNLKKFFEEADKNNDMLLFDECDSLITDRKRVGMILAAQINALLSELEKYKGIVVFTTNRLDALDPAFERRLSLKLEFPMPDKSHRLHIWKRMFPKQAPLATDIRWDDLASIKIAGGHIKNVVLASARMAAAQGDKEITDAVLWDCLEKEVAARDAYKDALDSNNQFYGTPLPNNGRSVDLTRVRGKGQSIG